MPSKIDVDLLLVALFDLPAGVQVQASSNNNVRPDVAVAPSRRRDDVGRRINPPDDGVETDNTSVLHGESISLTDEEYSDAVTHLSPPGRNEPSSFTTYRQNMLPDPLRYPAGETSEAYPARKAHLVAHPVGKSPDVFDIRGGGTLLDNKRQYNDSKDRSEHSVFHQVGRNPDEFVTRGGGISPPVRIMSELNVTVSKPSNRQTSPKRKKKRKSCGIKSLKKLVGRKSKSSSTALTISSSFDEAESTTSSPTAYPSSYVGSDEHSPNTPQNFVDDGSHLDKRLCNLKSKIGRIQSDIHSLEGDLIATRNELARAHQHLHFATMELADVQRAAVEADIGLSKLVQQQHRRALPMELDVRLSPLTFFEADMSTRSSTRSSSSYSLNYFTPTSSTAESDDESDCFTPRSTASHDSFSPLNEHVNLSTPILDETNERSNADMDRTPLTKNGKTRHRRRFKFESGLKASKSALTFSEDSNKEESFSIDTPCTAASTQEEINNDTGAEVSVNRIASKESYCEPKGRRVTFCKQLSFIRAHDLALANGSGISSLLPLYESDVVDVANALFEKGSQLANDESDRWTPEQGTGKILSRRAKKLQNGEIEGPMGRWPNAAHGNEVLVWTTKCPNGGHGSEYPMVKARGLIPTTSLQMVNLLLESGRVKQYNKMSLGRIDEHCFAEGVDKLSACSRTGIHGELKIVRSKSQPPVIRKPVELRLLLHARRCHSENGEGAKYLTIGRSVWETEHGTAGAEDTSVTRCEMLLSVNSIRDLQVSGEQWCEITTITHGVSPGIPISIGKRIGLAAAAKYVRDIRAVFE